MKTQLLILFSLLIIISCKKNEESDSTPTDNKVQNIQTAEYVQLNEGNYWVYQQYRIQLETGEKEIINRTDSIYVANDTIIAGQTFHQLKGTWFGTKFHRNLRIENNILYNSRNSILFNPQQNTFLLLKTDGNPQNQFFDSISWSMEKRPIDVLTPLMMFASEFQYNVQFFLNKELLPNPKYDVRNDTEYYVKGIGVVRYTSSYISPIDVHMDLLRFNVN